MSRKKTPPAYGESSGPSNFASHSYLYQIVLSNNTCCYLWGQPWYHMEDLIEYLLIRLEFYTSVLFIIGTSLLQFLLVISYFYVSMYKIDDITNLQRTWRLYVHSSLNASLHLSFFPSFHLPLENSPFSMYFLLFSWK